MPSAACSSVRPSGRAIVVSIVRRASSAESLSDAAGEIIRIDVAEDDRGVGHRRPLAAAAVAGGTGLRARRLRPDPQRAGAIDPGDRLPPPEPIAFTSTIGTRTE